MNQDKDLLSPALTQEAPSIRPGGAIQPTQYTIHKYNTKINKNTMHNTLRPELSLALTQEAPSIRPNPTVPSALSIEQLVHGGHVSR